MLHNVQKKVPPHVRPPTPASISARVFLQTLMTSNCRLPSEPNTCRWKPYFSGPEVFSRIHESYGNDKVQWMRWTSISITYVCIHAAVDHEPWRHHCWHRTTYTGESRIATNCQHQCPGRFLGIIGPNPSVSKSNRLHGVIFRFFFTSLRFSPFIGQHSVASGSQKLEQWQEIFIILLIISLHGMVARVPNSLRTQSALRPPFTLINY